jgi:hypothetical protein
MWRRYSFSGRQYNQHSMKCNIIGPKVAIFGLQCHCPLLWSYLCLVLARGLLWVEFTHDSYARPSSRESIRWTCHVHSYIIFSIPQVFLPPSVQIKSRDSVVGTETGYGRDDRGVGVRVPIGSRIFSFPCRPDRLWVHPTSYLMGTGGSFPGGKAAEAWSWPLTSN